MDHDVEAIEPRNIEAVDDITDEEQKLLNRYCAEAGKLKTITEVAKHAAKMMREGDVICNAYMPGAYVRLANEFANARAKENLAKLNEIGFYTMDGDGSEVKEREPTETQNEAFRQWMRDRWEFGWEPAFGAHDQHGWVMGVLPEKNVERLERRVKERGPVGLLVGIAGQPPDANKKGRIAQHGVGSKPADQLPLQLFLGYATDNPEELPVNMAVESTAKLENNNESLEEMLYEPVLSKDAMDDMFRNYVLVTFCARLPGIDVLEAAYILLNSME